MRSLYNFNLDQDVERVHIGFQNHQWTVGLIWKFNSLFFDEVWYNFLKDAKISEGDTCVLQATCDQHTFEFAIFLKNLLSQWLSRQGNVILNINTFVELCIPELICKYFKVILLLQFVEMLNKCLNGSRY